jgi:hypothetical protein
MAAEAAAEAQQCGYTPLTTAGVLRLTANLSRWMQPRGLGAADLSLERAREFTAARRAAGRRSGRSLRSLPPVLAALAGAGVLAADAPAGPRSEQDLLMAAFRQYLRCGRALAAGTPALTSPGRAVSLKGWAAPWTGWPPATSPRRCSRRRRRCRSGRHSTSSPRCVRGLGHNGPVVVDQKPRNIYAGDLHPRRGFMNNSGCAYSCHLNCSGRFPRIAASAHFDGRQRRAAAALES